MANFSWQVDPDTNQLNKKKPLVRPNPDDVYRQDADQPYDFGVANALQPVGGNPGTYDLNGSAKAGFMANSAIDPEFVKRSVAGLLSANTYDQQQIAPPGQPPATGSTQGADVAPDQSLLSGVANGVPQQQNIPTIAGAQGQINTLEQQKAAELANFHPSKLRQFMGGLAGVGAGIMSRNPIAGYGAYKGVVDSPKGDITSSYAEKEAPLLQQIASGKDLAAIQSTYMQRLGEVAKYGPNSPENITANAHAKAADTGAARLGMEQNETRNIEIGDPNVPGGKTPAIVNKFGTGQARPVGPTITPQPRQGTDFSNYWLPAAAMLKHPGMSREQAVAAMTPQETQEAEKDFAMKSQDPDAKAQMESLRNLEILTKQMALDQQPTPEQAASVAQDLISHRVAPEQMASMFGGFGVSGQNFKRMVYAEAKKLDPNFDFEQASSEYQLAKSPNFQQTVRYIDHVGNTLPRLVSSARALGNTSIKALNTLLTKGQEQFGGTNIKTFLADRDLVANELGRVLSGGGTGNATSDAKIKAAIDLISASDSPAQIAATISEVQPLLASRRTSLTRGTWMESANFGNEPAQSTGGTANTPPAAFTLPNGTTVHRQADGTYK